MFIAIYRYLSTSISLDECDYYRYISHIIINVIYIDEEIYIAIYPPKKFPDACNTDLNSKKDAKKLKQIMITDDEWDLIVDLTEILSVFADTTEDIRESKYVTNSMCTPMLMEIIKVVKPNSSYNQDFDEEEDDTFKDNDAEEEQDS